MTEKTEKMERLAHTLENISAQICDAEIAAAELGLELIRSGMREARAEILGNRTFLVGYVEGRKLARK